ncbi:DEKNAAC102343 [Brettanomyces naardenensis]|uniref:DEKNAAC102343 n=1 Tax=Brettanomyces naardenensis TaxID=13370 RepID=A0A448YLE8_BRENA|nr:DEKNAAC102343 [Brettanomyces naardenensis]
MSQISKEEFHNQADQLKRTIAGLALKVSQKEAELAKLEDQYNSKLEQVNNYLEQIHNALEIDAPADDSIDAEELFSKEVDPDFIIIPKKLLRVKYRQSKPQIITTGIDRKNKNKNQNRKKITCSYCMKEGHRRAECPERLSRPNSRTS